jgi:hypothetical protein
MRRPPGATGAVAPACVTVCTWPPIVTRPVRLDPLGFAETEYESSRDPEPLADDTLIQDTLDDADHAQPEVVDSWTELVDAPGCTDLLVGEIVNEQTFAA